MAVEMSALDLEVMEACTVMGKIAARAICATTPSLVEEDMAAAYGAEFFEVVRDMKALGVVEGQQMAARVRAQGRGSL